MTVSIKFSTEHGFLAPEHPAPGYNVRCDPSLGWVYDGRHHGRLNGGEYRADAVRATWEHFIDDWDPDVGTPLPSARAAMCEAGLKDWEHGKGLPTAEAIRELARQRDDARQRLDSALHELRNVLLPLNTAVDGGRGWMLGEGQLDRLNALGDSIAVYLRGER